MLDGLCRVPDERLSIRTLLVGFLQVLGLSVIWAGSALAAGIDCSRAYADDEAIICQSRSLLRADSDLAKLYAKLRNDSAIIISQRSWIKLRKECQDKRCLMEAYEVRIAHLQAYQSGELKGLDCDNPANNDIERSYCTSIDIEAANTAMDASYKSALKWYSGVECTSAEDEVDCKGAADALTKAQEAWNSYRENHCLYLGLQYPFGAHGGMQGLAISHCQLDLTRSRRWELDTELLAE